MDKFIAMAFFAFVFSLFAFFTGLKLLLQDYLAEGVMLLIASGLLLHFTNYFFKQSELGVDTN